MSGGDWKDMFAAATSGDVDLLVFHLAQGVDPDHVHPEYLSSALVASLCAGRADSAHLLLDHGADPTLYSPFEQMAPAEAAARAGFDDVLERLVGLGAPRPDLVEPVPAGVSPDGGRRPWWRALLRY